MAGVEEGSRGRGYMYNYGWFELLYGRKKWQLTPVLLPGKFHGWRSLVGYSPWGRKESDTTEWLHFLSFYSFFWRRKWQPTPVFLPGESHGQRGLVGYSLWGCKESDMTKQLTSKHTQGNQREMKFSLWRQHINNLTILCWLVGRGDGADVGPRVQSFNYARWKCFGDWTHGSVQSISHVRLFETPWTAAHQASLSITNSWSLLKLMFIESMMPSNHPILCCPLLLLASIFPSIRVFSNESALRITWPKYWSFNFNISPSNEHSGLISFRMDWLDLLAVQGTLKNLLQHHSSKASILWRSALFIVQLY